MFELIPAIDLIGGQAVRLRQGSFSDVRFYSESPLELAERFAGQGFKRLHLVDLDGARSGKIENLPVLRAIASECGLEIDFSGGIRSEEAAASALEAGARKICLGSLAALDCGLSLKIISALGPERVILAAGVRDGEVRIKGWQAGAGLSFDSFLEPFVAAGISEALITDIASDGMMAGPGFSLYAEARKRFPGLSIIASGGVATLVGLEIADSEDAEMEDACSEGRVCIARSQHGFEILHPARAAGSDERYAKLARELRHQI